MSPPAPVERPAGGEQIEFDVWRQEVLQAERYMKAAHEQKNMAESKCFHKAIFREGRLYNEGLRHLISWGYIDGCDDLVGVLPENRMVRLRDMQPIDPTPPQPATSPAAPESIIPTPDGAQLMTDGVILFKHNGDMFKQIRENGLLVGLMYRTAVGAWTTIGEAQVRSRYNIYRKRSEKPEVSDAVSAGLEQWGWALGLFGQPVGEERENLKPITLE